MWVEENVDLCPEEIMHTDNDRPRWKNQLTNGLAYLVREDVLSKHTGGKMYRIGCSLSTAITPPMA